MKTNAFLTELTEELELEVSLQTNTKFKDLEDWDSMGAMVLIGFVSDNFGITLTGDDIENLSDVQSLMEKIGITKFSE